MRTWHGWPGRRRRGPPRPGTRGTRRAQPARRRRPPPRAAPGAVLLLARHAVVVAIHAAVGAVEPGADVRRVAGVTTVGAVVMRTALGDAALVDAVHVRAVREVVHRGGPGGGSGRPGEGERADKGAEGKGADSNGRRTHESNLGGDVSVPVPFQRK